MDIIDFHVHAGTFHLIREDIQALLMKKSTEMEVDVPQLYSDMVALKAYLSESGIKRAVVLAECGPGTNFSTTSEEIAQLTRGHDFFIPFGNINPNYHDALEEFHRSVSLGMRGFKFYPAEHDFDPLLPSMDKVYGLCAERGLPVMFHTGLTAQRDAEQKYIHPSNFEPIAAAHPELIIILAHCGKPNWYQEAAQIAMRHANVYLDTALVKPDAIRHEYPETSPVWSKVLFASDWPAGGSVPRILAAFREAGFSDETLKDVFHNNAARLLAQAFARQERAAGQARTETQQVFA